jgi:hypothetical protein
MLTVLVILKVCHPGCPSSQQRSPKKSKVNRMILNYTITIDNRYMLVSNETGSTDFLGLNVRTVVMGRNFNSYFLGLEFRNVKNYY